MFNKNKIFSRSTLWQVAVLVALCLGAYYLIHQATTSLEKQGVATGWKFLSQESGFEIGETLIEYWSDETYLKALWVGLLNTIYVAIIGNVMAVLVGLFVGVFSMSPNWMISRICRFYVEIARNIPLLLQLFFWYSLFNELLPAVDQAFNLGDTVFLSQRGLKFPWFIGGHWEIPTLSGFDYTGGGTLTPEFLSLIMGLVFYTGAYNAEIVRAGIESIPKGQWEAAQSLGLTRIQMLIKVIIPQSMQVAIPPMISQLLNLSKNSSLAVAIGFPDFVTIANTTLNQTGQAVEVISLIMMVYLFMSLSTSFLANLYHRRIAHKGAER